MTPNVIGIPIAITTLVIIVGGCEWNSPKRKSARAQQLMLLIAAEVGLEEASHVSLPCEIPLRDPMCLILERDPSGGITCWQCQ